jgi:hypothetical protein
MLEVFLCLPIRLFAFFLQSKQFGSALAIHRCSTRAPIHILEIRNFGLL